MLNFVQIYLSRASQQMCDNICKISMYRYCVGCWNVIQNEQEQTLMSAKSRLESEKSDLTDLLEKRNREVDRLTGEMLYDA